MTNVHGAGYSRFIRSEPPVLVSASACKIDEPLSIFTALQLGGHPTFLSCDLVFSAACAVKRFNLDGSPQDWVVWAEAARDNLQLPDEKHWTQRPGIKLRGCTKQSDPTSFLSELINLRYSKHCRSHKLDVTATNVPMNLYTDIRHRLRNQDADGGIFLLTNSVPYHYHSDRTLVARESLGHMGWSHDSGTTTLRRAIPDWPEPSNKKKKAKAKAVPEESVAALAPPKKKRKAPANRRTSHEKLLSDLAGNAMGASEIDLVVYTGQLAMVSPMWPKGPPSLAQLKEMLGMRDDSSAPAVVLDPSAPSAEIANLFEMEEEEEDDDVDLDEEDD